jgi:hypothetical protein
VSVIPKSPKWLPNTYPICVREYFIQDRLKIESLNNRLATFATASVFGYAIGGGGLLPLIEAEIVVVSSIIGLGASQQARSHGKAALQLGVSKEVVKTIDDVAQEIADWNGTPLPEKLDVQQLAREVEAELAKLS